MEKINVCQKSTIQKIETCVKDKKQNLSFYRIQLIIRDNRNDARISLPIYEGGANPRITASSTTSAEEAIIKLLDKIKKELIISIEQKYINVNNLFSIFDNISQSLKDLNIQSDNLLTFFHNMVSNIYEILNVNTTSSNKIDTKPTLIEKNDNEPVISNINNQKSDTLKNIENLSFKEVAIKWFNYKNSFTYENKDNVKPLSKKTLQGYNRIMYLKLIPFFEKYRYIDDINDEQLQECIDKTNGYRHKEIVYVVLKMILDYAKENNYISYSRTIKKPPKVKKKAKLKIEGHELVYIKTSRQNYWLECFEKEATNIAYLFESMLLGGLRPEEACGLTWDSLIEDTNYFFIENAFKDFPIYNENAEIIGHTREYDDLKTEHSYRKIPIHPRFREILLKHKEKQKELFKKLNYKWTEQTPVFLNRFHKAYVSENLAKALKNFIKKYGLEDLTPYGLRHSFATFLSEQGMKDVVLMKLMGHSDFSTTQKYYIFISDERKKLEYEQAWGLTQNNEINIDIQNTVVNKILDTVQNLWVRTLENAIVA